MNIPPMAHLRPMVCRILVDMLVAKLTDCQANPTAHLHPMVRQILVDLLAVNSLC